MGYKRLESVEPKGKNRSIAISSWNGHCYMYKSAKLISQLRDLPYEIKNTESGGESINFVLQNETKSKLPTVDLWEGFDGNPTVGMFYTFDLKQTRQLLL